MDFYESFTKLIALNKLMISSSSPTTSTDYEEQQIVNLKINYDRYTFCLKNQISCNLSQILLEKNGIQKMLVALEELGNVS